MAARGTADKVGQAGGGIWSSRLKPVKPEGTRRAAPQPAQAERRRSVKGANATFKASRRQRSRPGVSLDTSGRGPPAFFRPGHKRLARRGLATKKAEGESASRDSRAAGLMAAAAGAGLRDVTGGREKQRDGLWRTQVWVGGAPNATPGAVPSRTQTAADMEALAPEPRAAACAGGARRADKRQGTNFKKKHPPAC